MIEIQNRDPGFELGLEGWTPAMTFVAYRFIPWSATLSGREQINAGRPGSRLFTREPMALHLAKPSRENRFDFFEALSRCRGLHPWRTQRADRGKPDPLHPRRRPQMDRTRDARPGQSCPGPFHHHPPGHIFIFDVVARMRIMPDKKGPAGKDQRGEPAIVNSDDVTP